MRSRSLTLILLSLLALPLAAEAQTYTYSTLYSFKNNGTDPAFPQANLIVDAVGNLYGSSANGGTFGFGTVFKITPNGKLSVLHNFQGPPNDGEQPFSSLFRDSAGNLYGTTANGGNSTLFACAGGIGCGTVFKVTPAGKETVLYNFTGLADGLEPFAPVVLDPSGNIYGTVDGSFGNGDIVFKLDKAGKFTVLYQFCSLPNCADGGAPQSGLLRDKTGNFFGSTEAGGISQNGGPTLGLVYELTPAGMETVLHDFTGGSDGANPQGNLVQDASGNLYGITLDDGTGGNGTVFKVTKGGAETVLYEFCSLPNCVDGGSPGAPVAIDKSGNIFGISFLGGANGNGAVWEVSTSGIETVLFSFTGPKGFGTVAPGLVIDSAGNLYGATFFGGPAHLGSVFKLTLEK